MMVKANSKTTNKLCKWVIVRLTLQWFEKTWPKSTTQVNKKVILKLYYLEKKS